MLCSLDGYLEKKGTGVEEEEYVLCSLDGYPEKKGTGVEEVIRSVRPGRISGDERHE